LCYHLKSLHCESDKKDLILGVYPELEQIELADMADRFSVDRTERGPKKRQHDNPEVTFTTPKTPQLTPISGLTLSIVSVI
jgi:hypothetical protein